MKTVEQGFRPGNRFKEGEIRFTRDLVGATLKSLVMAAEAGWIQLPTGVAESEPRLAEFILEYGRLSNRAGVTELSVICGQDPNYLWSEAGSFIRVGALQIDAYRVDKKPKEIIKYSPKYQMVYKRTFEADSASERPAVELEIEYEKFGGGLITTPSLRITRMYKGRLTTLGIKSNEFGGANMATMWRGVDGKVDFAIIFDADGGGWNKEFDRRMVLPQLGVSEDAISGFTCDGMTALMSALVRSAGESMTIEECVRQIDGILTGKVVVKGR